MSRLKYESYLRVKKESTETVALLMAMKGKLFKWSWMNGTRFAENKSINKFRSMIWVIRDSLVMRS